jgi:hypothetical protein
MKKRHHISEEDLDEAVSSFLLFFLVMFLAVAALNFESVGMLLGLYGGFVALMWSIAAVIDHRPQVDRYLARRVFRSDLDLDRLMRESAPTDKTTGALASRGAGRKFNVAVQLGNRTRAHNADVAHN